MTIDWQNFQIPKVAFLKVEVIFRELLSSYVFRVENVQLKNI